MRSPCDERRCPNVPEKPFRCHSCKVTLCQKHGEEHISRGHSVSQPKISESSGTTGSSN